MISLFGMALILSATAVQAEGPGSTRVAVVHVASVSEQYSRTRDLEAQFESLRARLGQDRDAQRDRIERLKRSLQEELKPGSDEFRERRKELAIREAELQVFVETEGQKIEEGLKSSLRGIFSDIQAVVSEIATERGIDVVLAADRLPPENPDTPTQLRQQILLQKVLFWSPRVDITDEVIARLNARHKMSTSEQGMGGSPPAAAAGGGNAPAPSKNPENAAAPPVKKP